MRKFMLIILLISTISISGPLTAGIGIPDGDNTYENVGVLIIFDLDASPYPVGNNVSTFCSGVLITEVHFLTAAHCIDWISTVGSPYVGVSFSNAAAPIIESTIPATAYYMHPEYPAGQWVSPGSSPGAGFGLSNDLGIVELQYPPGITPAALPYEGYLDELTDQGGMVKQRIVNVGYGVVPFQKRAPGYSPPDGIRRVSTSRFLGLTQNFLLLHQNINAGNEGNSAPGDSGSPKFLPEDDTVLAITSWGDPANRGFLASIRVDTEQALDFIISVVWP